MKRQWLIVALLSFFLCTNAEKRALVIGIGAYPTETGWDAINGDNDIPFVMAVLADNGFSESNIVTLSNEDAIYSNIRRALMNTISLSANGDVVYIHFSGHGQQITDLNGDETDGFDEAWIPYDAHIKSDSSYHGEYHLVDDELNHYLMALRQKVGSQGKIIVVSDACHSGTGSRKQFEQGVRGTSSKFLIADNVPLLLQRYSFSEYVISSKHRPQPEQWLYISACAADECNRQYTGRGEGDNSSFPCGSLTYALYLLRNSLSQKNAKELRDELHNLYHNKNFITRPQTPQFDCLESMLQVPVL